MGRKKTPDPVWTGADELRGSLVPIGDLTLDPNNARRHPNENLRVIKRSLEKWGQVKSIVVRDGVVVAGNGLLTQAQALGWSHIAAVEFGRSEADAAEFGLVDNRSAELAEWEPPQLVELLQGIQADPAREILDAGFSEDDLAELLASISGEPEELPEAVASTTLAERFGVPPFSVLDARQGYWQDRKRAWLALGIQSELGRGGGTWRESATGSPTDRQRAYSEARVAADEARTRTSTTLGAIPPNQKDIMGRTGNYSIKRSGT